MKWLRRSSSITIGPTANDETEESSPYCTTVPLILLQYRSPRSAASVALTPPQCTSVLAHTRSRFVPLSSFMNTTLILYTCTPLLLPSSNPSPRRYLSSPQRTLTGPSMCVCSASCPKVGPAPGAGREEKGVEGEGNRVQWCSRGVARAAGRDETVAQAFPLWSSSLAHAFSVLRSSSSWWALE